MFEAKDIFVARGGKEILHGVSLSVPTGTLTVVLGQNGAGKSTLLHALSGGSPVSAGTVTCDGRDIVEWRSRELARRRAVLMQSTHPAFDFTVQETVMLGRLPWISGAESKEDFAIAHDALSKVGLDENFFSRRLSTLSGGELQRVQIARVFAQANTGIQGSQNYSIFLDEPISSLDLTHRFEVMRQLLLMARCGYAVFVVLHDLNLALLFADQVAIMKNGRIEIAGTPAETLTVENLDNIFGIRTEIFNGPSGSFIHILGGK